MAGHLRDAALEGKLRRSLISAYPLDEVGQIEQVHDGNNRVYRLKCRAPAPYDQMAVKLSKPGSGGIAGKLAEKTILDYLYHDPAFPFVPRLLAPTAEPGHARCQPWGVLWDDGALLTCYRWVEAQRYRGSGQQLVQVGKRYGQLQQALPAINPAALPPAHHRLSRAADGRLQLAEDFTFSAFNAFIKSRAGGCAASAMLNLNLAFLEQEVADLREGLDQHKRRIECWSRCLIHQELSPSNFGFAHDDSVSIIFDFDSISDGFPLQDTAWLCATFCVDYRKLPGEVARSATVLLSSIRSQAAMPDGWQELLIPFMRLGYLAAIHRKLRLAHGGVDPRLGFVKEDILCLQWLRRHGGELALSICRGTAP
ncbi:MAG: hypothetical protein EPN14_09290 [Gallionella sp.]|nr:MAG: hypothetical protein EPN14_09290 [Gallionella sp.]